MAMVGRTFQWAAGGRGVEAATSWCMKRTFSGSTKMEADFTHAVGCHFIFVFFDSVDLFVHSIFD